jgi:hypothetical protein
MTSSTGRFTRDRPVRESRILVNMRNQPHCDNGEGVAMPRPYPLLPRKESRWAETTGCRSMALAHAALPERNLD